MNLLGFFAVFVLTFFPTQTPHADSGNPQLIFFNSRTCDDCIQVKEDFLPGFLEKYGSHIEFIEWDIEVPGVLDSLEALEIRAGIPEDRKAFPAVYFMGNVLEGQFDVRFRLEELVQKYLDDPEGMRQAEQEFFSLPVDNIFTPVETSKPVALAYFYERGCIECSRAEEIIEWLKRTHPEIIVDTFNIGDNRNKLLSAYLAEQSGMPEERFLSTPVFFIGSRYLLSEDISRSTLNEYIIGYSDSGAEPFWRYLGEEELGKAENTLTELFHRFTFAAIALAGLGDGINPCAFATILLFVSYLGLIGRKKYEILVVGFAFAFSVFITYFLVGLGFFGILRSITDFSSIAKVIYGGFAVICFVFGAASLYDWKKARSSKSGEMLLQLPEFLKKKIHATVREKARTRKFVIGAVTAGFIVSMLELACTGQVYLPTITLMAGRAQDRYTAIIYLLVYNIFFILPLMAVFGIVYFGVSSKRVANVMEARLGTVKLVLAGIFFLLGFLLVSMVV